MKERKYRHCFNCAYKDPVGENVYCILKWQRIHYFRWKAIFCTKFKWNPVWRNQNENQPRE